jgi:hypothetical protein
MGNLRSEISDSSSITIPLPLSSVLSVLTNQNTPNPPINKSSVREKAEAAFGNPLSDNSQFHMKSRTEDTMGVDTDNITPAIVTALQFGEQATPLKAPPGEPVIPRLTTTSCNPVAGAKVAVTLIGIPEKTHIADCITRENGDFSFYMLPFTEIPPDSLYTFNFEITPHGLNLPAGSSSIVTDLANVSDGPLYTFNVCLQQPSEPNAVAFTRGGIAVFGKFSS